MEPYNVALEQYYSRFFIYEKKVKKNTINFKAFKLNLTPYLNSFIIKYVRNV